LHKEIVIDTEGEETRVAVLEDGRLVEIYIERSVSQGVVGNVYKGRVDNVLPGMQAAFVDIGLDKNAFLYVDDAGALIGGRDGRRRRNVSVRDMVRVNQEIVVQVTKEAMGGKGPRVTTYCTLPGRYLVLMPTVQYIGVSRRIKGERERARLRKLAERIKPPDAGLIVRTAAEGRDERELRQDLDLLTKVWAKIQARAQSAKAPALLHRDFGLVYRIVRDLFTDDVDRLHVDSRHEYDRILELLDLISPHLKDRVHLFQSRERSIFELYGIDSAIEEALKRRVWLKSGGYIVIDETEALTVVDVNTGKYVGSTNLEDTVYKTNLEAAREIARQLRLRDIGGIVIVDFIDMDSPAHRQKVLEVFEESLRKDRTRVHIMGLTQLGMVELTRKKVREGLASIMQRPCPYCDGKGRVLSEETMARKVRREIKRILRHATSEAILVEVHPSVAALLIGAGGSNLRELERETGKAVYIRGSTDVHLERMNLRALGTRDEIETKALPVKTGEILEVKIEEPHASNPWDGIGRVEGYVLNVGGAGKKVGETVKVRVVKVHRTYAKACLLEDEEEAADKASTGH